MTRPFDSQSLIPTPFPHPFSPKTSLGEKAGMRGYHSLHNRIKYPHSLAFFFYRNERIYGKNHHVGFRATTSTQPTGAEVRSRGLSANGTNFGEFFQKINKSLRSLRLRGESFSIHPLNSDSRLTIHGSRLPFLVPQISSFGSRFANNGILPARNRFADCAPNRPADAPG